MLFSFLELTSNTADEVAHTSPVPPEYEAVESYPPGYSPSIPLVASEIYSLWQRDHGRPLLNGAPAVQPRPRLATDTARPEESGTAAALAALGVTAIVIHPRTVDVEVATPGDAALGGATGSSGDFRRLVRVEGDGASRAGRRLSARAGLRCGRHPKGRRPPSAVGKQRTESS